MANSSMAAMPHTPLAVATVMGTRDVGTVVLAGELDRSNENRVREAIDRVLSEGASCLIVDLGRLSSMDSSGVHLLLHAANTLSQRRGHLAVVAPAGSVRRILDVACISPFVRVYPTHRNALAESSCCGQQVPRDGGSALPLPEDSL